MLGCPNNVLGSPYISCGWRSKASFFERNIFLESWKKREFQISSLSIMWDLLVGKKTKSQRWIAVHV